MAGGAQESPEWALASDGLIAWRTGGWAQEKLFYLSRYFNIFNAGMQRKWPERVYIDLFCGAGRLLAEREEIEGSAVMALRSQVPFTRCFFNDLEPRAVQALKERAEQIGGPTATYFSEDCNTVIPRIRSELPAQSLDLAFVDPSTWQIALESIAALTADRRMDLVITFHVGGMKRAAHSQPQSLSSFFGTPLWRKAYQQSLHAGRREGSRILLDCYEEQLRKLGYKWVVDDVRITNSRHVGLYHLVFASKSERGEDFWEKITARSASGQMRLFQETPAEYQA
jgi:three-Cys-motif partner protein